MVCKNWESYYMDIGEFIVYISQTCKIEQDKYLSLLTFVFKQKKFQQFSNLLFYVAEIRCRNEVKTFNFISHFRWIVSYNYWKAPYMSAYTIKFCRWIDIILWILSDFILYEGKWKYFRCLNHKCHVPDSMKLILYIVTNFAKCLVEILTKVWISEWCKSMNRTSGNWMFYAKNVSAVCNTIAD